jgi:hypothetical protein
MTITLARWATSGTAGVILLSGGFLAGKSLTTPTVTPQVQAGTVVQVGGSGAEFILRPAGNGPLTGYALPGSMPWRNAYGVWQGGGRPACMGSLTHGQRITIGVINAAPVAGAPGSPVLVWLECPGKPVPRYPIVSPPATTRP